MFPGPAESQSCPSPERTQSFPSNVQETWLGPRASLVSLHLEETRTLGSPGKREGRALRLTEPPDGPIGEQAS